MQWLSDLPFGDNRVVQIGLIAACGVAALVILATIYRLAFAHRLRVPAGRTRQPRLGLVDAFSLDGQRQLVLVRRDNVEHLIMIGGPNDVLVESQISRAFAAARENNVGAQPAPARRAEPSPSAPPSDKAPAPVAAPRPAVEAPSSKSPPVPAEPKPASASAGAAAPPATPATVRSGSPAAPLVSPPEPQKAAPPSGTPARLAPSRAMPPPIAPLARTNVARISDASPEKAAAQPAEPKGPPAPLRLERAPAAAPLSPIPLPDKIKAASAPQPEKSVVAHPETASGEKANKPNAPAVESGLKAPLGSPGAVEVSARMAPAGLTPSIAKADAKREHNGAAPEKQEAGANSPRSHADAPEDPFAGLDSLEAEMARLLGREKLN